MNLIHNGCGDQVGRSWQNFDMSPMLFVERLPFGKLLKRLIGGADYAFLPGVQFGNIVSAPLVKRGTANAAYASHVLEHLTREDALAAIRNVFEMLAPGGVFRLIVPDLAWRARLYLSDLDQNSFDASSNFMRSAILGQEFRQPLVRRLRSMVSGSSHLWMWDYPSMRHALEAAGFTGVRRCEPGDAQPAEFAEVENRERFWSHPIGHPTQRELSIECVKPM